MKKIDMRKIDGGKLKRHGISDRSVLEKEPSEFDGAYTDEEHCYIIEGKAEIAAGTKELLLRRETTWYYPGD